jgi:uncharacterized cupin superfamily protein
VDRVTPAHLEPVALRPYPIPEAWILGGAPRARLAELSRSPDGARVVILWDCTAGEYIWRGAAHERLEILEGEAIVDDGSGPRRLGPGARASFPAGAIVRWRVPAYVKKLADRRAPRRRAIARALHALLSRRRPVPFRA